MAAALKATQTKKNKLAKSFKDRLDKLGCPYTEGLDESWILELLLKPGEHRIRLLQWLFSKFDSRLNDVLDPQHASIESKMDSRVQRLLFVASTLGLCRYDDVDLIRGVNTKQEIQISFLDQLLDNVCIIDTAEDPQNKALQTPGVVSDAMSLDEQFKNDCMYIDTLVNQERIDDMFNPRLSFLPPDLQRRVEEVWVQEGHSKDKPPKPDLQCLKESANQLSKDLERQKEILEELSSTYNYQEPDESRMEKVRKTMQLVLTELFQLVSSFSYCYENEMRHWCNKTPPDLTQLGPAFKRVHTLLQQFVNLLHGYQSIRASYTNLSRDSSRLIHGLVSKQKKFTDLSAIGDAALLNFQEVVDILDQSLQRKGLDSSMASTAGSTSLNIRT